MTTIWQAYRSGGSDDYEYEYARRADGALFTRTRTYTRRGNSTDNWKRARENHDESWFAQNGFKRIEAKVRLPR